MKNFGFILQVTLVLVGFLLPSPAVAQSQAEQEEAARQAGLQWLEAVDAGAYLQSWEEASAIFRESISAEQWESSLGQVRGQTGAIQTREVENATHTMELPDAPPGHYLVLEYDASFANLDAVETLVLREESSGWKVVGYFVRPG